MAAVVHSIGEPVNVVGHSHGGHCALEAALLTPHLRRLILYESVPLRGADDFTPGIADRLQALLAAGDAEGMLVAMFRELVEMPPDELELLRAQRDSWVARVANAATLPGQQHAAMYTAPGMFVAEVTRFLQA